MKKILDSPLLIALAGSIMIPFLMWAQEGELEGLHALPPGCVMKFERVGGSTWQTFGTYDSFWIYPDGKVINNVGKAAQVSPDAVRQWLKTITQQASPLTLKEYSSLMKSCPECFECRITIYDKDRTRTLDWVGRLQHPDITIETIPGIFDWLQNLVWSPLMGAPLQAEGFIQSNSRQIETSEEVLQSKLIRRVEPVYPEQAASARLSGKVVLLITVDEAGVPADVLVVSGNAILADSAVAAAIQWRYTPMPVYLESNPGSWEHVPMRAAVTVSYTYSDAGGTVEYVGDRVDPVKNDPTRK